MAKIADTQDASALAEAFVKDAVARDVPPEVAEAAKRVTVRRLSLVPGTPVTQSIKRRAQSYFDAVVLRKVVRSGVSRKAAARFVLAAVVGDLRSAGRDGVDIWQELERGWSSQIPGEVLEEYRTRLCS